MEQHSCSRRFGGKRSAHERSRVLRLRRLGAFGSRSCSKGERDSPCHLVNAARRVWKKQVRKLGLGNLANGGAEQNLCVKSSQQRKRGTRNARASSTTAVKSTMGTAAGLSISVQFKSHFCTLSGLPADNILEKAMKSVSADSADCSDEPLSGKDEAKRFSV
jgi:hypothetical protein